jgi:putative transcriptional regulator
MAKLPQTLTPEEQAAIAATDWDAIDAMSDDDIAQQIADNPDAAPDLSDAPASAIRVVHPQGGVNVRGIRAKLGMTQDDFARRFGFPVGSLRDWEQGRCQPEASTRTLLLVIEQSPDLVASVVIASRLAA